jgi:VanZ family protein
MSSDSTSQAFDAPRRGSPSRITVTVLLCLYWAALFYATHMPMPKGALPGNSDKFIHFIAYAGLGLLLMTLQVTYGTSSLSRLITCWLIVAGFGIFDEVTQLLVSRNADIHDWLYDITGAATGLVLVKLIAESFRSKIRGAQ